jgi:hypothetical protein
MTPGWQVVATAHRVGLPLAFALHLRAGRLDHLWGGELLTGTSPIARVWISYTTHCEAASEW